MISIVLYQCHYKIDKIFIMKVRSIVDASEDALHAIHIFTREDADTPHQKNEVFPSEI